MPLLFWTLVALMSAAAMAIVVWPLWRGRLRPGLSRRKANIAIYRERVAELHADARAQRLPEQEARALEKELGRRLLAETDSADTQTPEQRPRRPWALTLAVVVLLPVLGGALYWRGGNWQLVGDGPPPLSYLEAQLDRRVAQAPGDLRAWQMLGRTREAMGHFSQAAQAYARVNALLPKPSAAALTKEAMAYAAASRSLAGRPTELFRAALRADPDYGVALWFAGMAAAQADQPEQALQYWQRLAKKKGLPARMQALLDKQLAQLSVKTGTPKSQEKP
ncbi:MAG: c-type cytochrome biogenesis protein CcmI [Salinisphaera sp.]|nr:c-type cytochrome biogenesis protein CcmI [Salinisphaera sp.]